MKIIGSRTGCYEYNILFPTGFWFCMGQKPNSDYDILLNKNESPPIGQGWDIFYGEPTAPYIEGGRVFVPKTLDYLMYPLANKLYFQNKKKELFENYKQTAEIFNKSMKKVGELYLDFEKINQVHCQYVAKTGELFIKHKAIKPMA